MKKLAVLTITVADLETAAGVGVDSMIGEEEDSMIGVGGVSGVEEASMTAEDVAAEGAEVLTEGGVEGSIEEAAGEIGADGGVAGSTAGVVARGTRGEGTGEEAGVGSMTGRVLEAKVKIRK